VTDDLGREVFHFVQPATTSATFTCPLTDFLGRTGCESGIGQRRGTVVDELRATPVYVARITAATRSTARASVRQHPALLQRAAVN